MSRAEGSMLFALIVTGLLMWLVRKKRGRL